MTAYLSELAGILEQEIAVAEELDRNLSAQKQAIVDWNIDALLTKIDAREPWLRVLDGLEQQRNHILGQNTPLSEYATLRQAIDHLPKESADTLRLVELRERTRNIFVRLQAEENYLHRVMGNLLALIQQALSPLVQPGAPTYGESGVAERQRPASALLQSKV